MNDSTIQLKNMTDTYTIGEAYIVGDSQLHIKWCRFNTNLPE